jgi:hypothetical protein
MTVASRAIGQNGYMTADNLPRLLYVGDVPVESSYHGSVQLHRLLETYPVHKLEIVEAGTVVSMPRRRLPGVRYSLLRLPLARLQTTRFASIYATVCLLAASNRVGGFKDVTVRFRPEAILTVTHGYSWISAANLAQQLAVPLHLICHDEWARDGTPGGLQAWKERAFGEHYRAATSRMCISPFMAKSYETRYGSRAIVLYPARAANAKCYPKPADRLVSNSGPFTCAFAGNINTGGLAITLKLLAHCLEKVGGRLLIFGPIDEVLARSTGLRAPNIELRGYAMNLSETLRETADTLFVPMSFMAEARHNMEISFPSKLADYTAVGLPLLIFGPDYCSAVQWAKANDGVAEIVTEQKQEFLSAALSRLAQDSNYRYLLAERALDVGARNFTHAVAMQSFCSALGWNLDEAA